MVLEGHALSEVQGWDLEELDAYLAVLEMRSDSKTAAGKLAAQPKKAVD